MSSLTSCDELPNPERVRALQKRIGWLCHLGRLLAAAYAMWTLWLVVTFWWSAARVARRFAMIAGVDVVPLGDGTRYAGFAINMFVWVIVAATCLTAWRLFSVYLAGHIFKQSSAMMLRRVALLGLVTVVIDIAVRPLLVWLITGIVPAYDAASYYYFTPHDLALLMFFISLFAIAHIFKVAAELADENAGIL